MPTMRDMSAPDAARASAGNPPQPPYRRVLSVLGTAVAVACAMAFTLGEAAFASTDYGDTDAALGLMALWTLIGAGSATALVWRSRHPIVVCLVTAGLSVAFPIGWLAPLLALTWVIATRSWRWAAGCTAAVALAVGVGHLRDLRREGEGVIFAITDEVTGELAVLHPAGAIAIGVVTLGTAAAAGLIRRYRRAERLAREAELAQLHTSASLRGALSRQDERELIAREMHDTVAHHLSLVSLQASALEVTADDPATDIGDSARSMRSSAQHALEEMRSLIVSLRDSQTHVGGGDYTGPTPTLADLPDLINEARAAGAQVAATVFVTEAEAAPPMLTRAVYRIVQESLTNAVKHAPGAGVGIDVRAAPGHGVVVTVRNTIVAVPAAQSGGAGLLGMRERAEAVGGTLQAGPDGELFVVHAQLPWAGDQPR